MPNPCFTELERLDARMQYLERRMDAARDAVSSLTASVEARLSSIEAALRLHGTDDSGDRMQRQKCQHRHGPYTYNGDDSSRW